MRLLFRASLRYLLRHWAQCAMATAGIALGVAIVVGMQAAQQSARQAFDASLGSVFGTATHVVTGVAGDFDEGVLATVRRLAPNLRPAPVLEGTVRLAGEPAAAFRVIGIDPLAVVATGSEPGFDLRAFMRRPGAVVLNAATAARIGVATGDRITTRGGPLDVLAVLDGGGGAGGRVSDQALLADLSTAQETLAMPGRLSRIELHAPDNSARTAAVLDALRAALPPELMLVDAARAARSAREMTRAFYTNLDALSLLAVLVGGFMIYNTVAFLVVRRHAEFARLRALGVTRGEIVRLVAGEALVLGLAGGALGVAFGHGVAGALVGAVTRNMRDHYFDPGTVAVGFSPALAAAALVLGTGVTLAAAVVPAWQAARTEPADATRRSRAESASRTALARAEVAGVGMALVAAALLLGSERSLYAGFGALGCFILAGVLVVPRFVQRLLGGIEALVGARLPLPERLALRAGSRSMGRIGMAVAALTAATATAIGVGMMVASFRVSVNDWLGELLRADLYVSQEFDARSAPAIDEAFATALLAEPGVAALSRVRREVLRLADGDIRVTAYDLPVAARAGFQFLAGDPAAVWRAWQTEDVAIVSEPFAWRHGATLGEDYALPTPGGVRTFRIVGIYADYGSEHGVLALSLATFRRHWQDGRVHGLGVYPAPGADAPALRAAVEALVAPRPELAVWSNAEIRAESMAVFDRTFIVTDVLTVFAALIAALGVFNALMALALEREREYTVMRATGCGPGLMRRMLYGQMFAVGLLAGALAIPLGAFIAVMLIEVINVRSFGWTMTLHGAWRELGVPAALAVLASLAAGVVPAERAVRIEPAQALRGE